MMGRVGERRATSVKPSPRKVDARPVYTDISALRVFESTG